MNQQKDANKQLQPEETTEQDAATGPSLENRDRNVSVLENKIKELETKIDEEKNKYLYLYSEFQNFKKQMIRERSELIRFGWEPIAEELLQIIDNLERATSHLSSSSADTKQALMDGIRMVLGQFKAVLEKQGVKRIETSHQELNPDFHEVIAQESSDQPKGTILKEHIPGYTLHGRLVRPAQVIVSAGNEPAKRQNER